MNKRFVVVLVLGAGASKPYGLPSGSELVRAVYDGIRHGGSGTILDALTRCGVEASEVQAWAEALTWSASPSVDAFLEQRPDNAHELHIGKLAIAAALLACEKAERLRFVEDPAQDWYRHFYYAELGGAIDPLLDGRLRIVTFNYDRSFESFLFNALQHGKRLNVDECREALCQVQIAHVYGSLGPLDVIDPNGVPYGGGDHSYVSKAAEGINVWHEGEETPGMVKARGYIDAADVIHFLGFGFHRANVERLWMSPTPQTVILGTAVGMTTREIQTARELVGRAAGKNAPDPVFCGDLDHRWGRAVNGTLAYMREYGLRLRLMQ